MKKTKKTVSDLIQEFFNERATGEEYTLTQIAEAVDKTPTEVQKAINGKLKTFLVRKETSGKHIKAKVIKYHLPVKPNNPEEGV